MFPEGPALTAGSASPDPTSATATDGSSPTSTRPKGFLDHGTRKAYEKSAKIVATAASALIETRAGAGTGGFLMLPVEAQDIAEPASRLLARHAPQPGTGKITDLGDLVELVVAAFGYFMNGLGRRTALLTGGGPAIPDQPTETPVDGPTVEASTIPSWPGPQRPPEVGVSS
jgi:hypothetical protein